MPAPPKTYKYDGYLQKAVHHCEGDTLRLKVAYYTLVPGSQFDQHGQLWVGADGMLHRTDGPAIVCMAWSRDEGMRLETWINGNFRRRNLNLYNRDWKKIARAS